MIPIMVIAMRHARTGATADRAAKKGTKVEQDCVRGIPRITARTLREIASKLSDDQALRAFSNTAAPAPIHAE